MSNILREANTAYDLAIMRIDAVVEAANRQREINFHEAELKVMQEAGTDDELSELIEAAESDFVENIQKALERLRDAIVKFFSDCRQKLVDLMGKRDDAAKLDKLENRMKLIPLLGKKKVMVEDYDAEVALAKKHLKSLNALAAKLRGKQEVDASEVAAVKKAFDDAHDNIIGASNAKAVTINDAVKMAKKMIASGSAELKEREATALKACDDAKKDAEKVNANVSNQIANAICHICKVSQNDYHRCVNGIMTSIKNAIGTYKAPGNSDVKKESTDDNDAEMETLANQANDTNSNDSVDEGANDDYAKRKAEYDKMADDADEEHDNAVHGTMESDDDDDIDLGFDIANDDALTAGLDIGNDDIDSDDDTLDDTDFDDDDACTNESTDTYLASLAGVATYESSFDSHSNSYDDLMNHIMNL